MNELIKITTNEENQKTVSARDLHEFLESKERFSRWIKRMFSYGFQENIDFTGCTFLHAQSNSNLEDYTLTLDCGKQISMLQKSEKGIQARQYFIDCEKKLKEVTTHILPTTFAEALKLAYEQQLKIEQQENTIATQKQVLLEHEPKIQYVDTILKSKSLLTVTQIAKDYGLTAQTLNKHLHQEGIQFKQSGQWLLYDKYASLGYTKSETVEYCSGKTTLNTKWTQKGRLFINQLLESLGIVAIMDYESK